MIIKVLQVLTRPNKECSSLIYMIFTATKNESKSNIFDPSVWRVVLFSITTTRLGLLIVGVLTLWLAPMNPDKWHFSSHVWLDIWARWDSTHYVKIATNGYSFTLGEYSNVAFFPLYPIILRIVSLGSQNIQLITAVGWIISNIAIIFVFILIYLLIEEDFGKDTAWRTIWLMALFPTSFYFSCVYTEGLFLFLTVAAFFSARRRKWLITGILGGLSSATRPTGVFLILPLLYEWYLQNRRFRITSWPLILVPCGLLSYMLYLWHKFGNPLLFLTVQQNWGRTTSLNMSILNERLVELFSTPSIFQIVHLFIESLFTIAAFGLLIVSIKWLRKSYQIYILYSMGIPLMTLSLTSMPRYFIIAFPLYVVMARLLSKPKSFNFVMVAFGFIQAILFAQWSLWFWLA